jgi:hypothetical protein
MLATLSILTVLENIVENPQYHGLLFSEEHCVIVCLFYKTLLNLLVHGTQGDC